MTTLRAKIEAIPGWMDKTASQLHDALAANQRHWRNAPITGGDGSTSSVNLLHLLTARFKVLYQDNKQTWCGPLQDLADVQKAAGNPVVSMILGLLYPHLQVEGTICYCADSDEAAVMINTLTDLVAGIVDASNGTDTGDDVRDAVALLTGGRIGNGHSIEEIQAVLDTIDMESQRALIQASFASTYNEACTALQSWDGTGDAPRLVLFDGG